MFTYSKLSLDFLSVGCCLRLLLSFLLFCLAESPSALPCCCMGLPLLNSTCGPSSTKPEAEDGEGDLLFFICAPVCCCFFLGMRYDRFFSSFSNKDRSGGGDGEPDEDEELSWRVGGGGGTSFFLLVPLLLLLLFSVLLFLVAADEGDDEEDEAALLPSALSVRRLFEDADDVEDEGDFDPLPGDFDLPLCGGERLDEEDPFTSEADRIGELDGTKSPLMVGGGGGVSPFFTELFDDDFDLGDDVVVAFLTSLSLLILGSRFLALF